MNDVINAILKRRSVRNYMSIIPPHDEIKMIIDCGLFAPTARGIQPWFFSVVKNRDILNEISAENKQIILNSDDDTAKIMLSDNFDNFCGAPMAIIVSADDTAKYAEADSANATENMALAASSLGISSCYIASFRPAFNGTKSAYFRNVLQIPIGYSPRFALALGYTNAPDTPRKERAENRVVYIEK
ncbi:MAG: nitroreductase family protein [Clostridia bacterium]